MYDDNISITISKNPTFIEHFYTIGLDSNLIIQNYLYITDIATLNENKAVKPEIINKFPNKSCLEIDDEAVIKVFILILALLPKWILYS
jgi:hypothetical protein